MKKSDKWVVIRVSVDEARKIEQSVYSKYTKVSNSGNSKAAASLKDLWMKLWKLLEIEDDYKKEL